MKEIVVPHHLEVSGSLSFDKQLLDFWFPPSLPFLFVTVLHTILCSSSVFLRVCACVWGRFWCHPLYSLNFLSIQIDPLGIGLGMQLWTGRGSSLRALRPLTCFAVRPFTTTSILQRTKKSKETKEKSLADKKSVKSGKFKVCPFNPLSQSIILIHTQDRFRPCLYKSYSTRYRVCPRFCSSGRDNSARCPQQAETSRRYLGRLDPIRASGDKLLQSGWFQVLCELGSS